MGHGPNETSELGCAVPRPPTHIISASDLSPFLVCHISNGQATERIGRTEIVKDDLNPVWTTTISFEYTHVTAASNLLIDIFDRDSASASA